jgi:hypothetical protein
VLEAAEVADDRRQRRRHDRLVERRDEEDEEQRAENQAPLTRGGFSHGIAAHRRYRPPFACCVSHRISL